MLGGLFGYFIAKEVVKTVLDIEPSPKEERFVDSAAIASITDSSIAGAILGGDIEGSILGDILDGDLLD